MVETGKATPSEEWPSVSAGCGLTHSIADPRGGGLPYLALAFAPAEHCFSPGLASKVVPDPPIPTQ